MSGHDVTDTHAAQVALRSSEERYRFLFNSIDAGFCEVGVKFDSSGRAVDYVFLEVNPAFERQSGIDGALGRSMREIAPAHEQKWFDIYGDVARTGQAVRFEQEAKALERWFAVSAFRVGDPKDHRVAVVFDDITGRKHAESRLSDSEARLRELNETLEARVAARTAELDLAHAALRQSQRLEAMGQLTGGVAHDFNNLLTPIIGVLDILQRQGIGGEREQRLIGGAADSADRAKHLVHRLLAFARRQPLQSGAVQVGQLIEGMGDLVARTIGPRIKVVLDVAEGLPPAIADPDQLEMALLNLCANARDAMPRGGVLRICVAMEAIGPEHRSGLPAKEFVRMSVTDTGVGMDETTVARAVEPFFSTKGVGTGAGLGLSMAHGLASQLGGALLIDSTPGAGTQVELWLPVSSAEAQPLPGAPLAEARLSMTGRALVVDDEAAVRMSTADMLAEMGFSVVEAETGEHAIRVMEQDGPFEIVVTDHLMPGMSGVDLAREVQSTWPGTPVLIVSGYAEVEAIEASLPRLSKPFRQSELAARINGMLSDA